MSLKHKHKQSGKNERTESINKKFFNSELSRKKRLKLVRVKLLTLQSGAVL